jgi:hypothetical protein
MSSNQSALETASPAMLWPPPLIDSGMPCVRARQRPRHDVRTPAHRRNQSAARSIIAFHTERASSYPESPGWSKAPGSGV